MALPYQSMREGHVLPVTKRKQKRNVNKTKPDTWSEYCIRKSSGYWKFQQLSIEYQNNQKNVVSFDPDAQKKMPNAADI